MTQKRLDGSVALVTGASSGIGEATAVSLADLGAEVALVARRADRLADRATRITDAGGTALVLEADVTGREAAEGAPRQVADIVHVSSVAGRVVRSSSGVYKASKHALGAFSEGMRQEFTGQGLRSSLVEPGATATELAGHNREDVQVGLRQRFGGMTRLEAQDIADVIAFVVTRPRHVAVNEVLVRPTDQEQ